MDTDSDEDVCRVCRSGTEPDHPLFHPCKCSGSIRYVHQDCLIAWLQTSRKRYCETCSANYEFTKVYDPSMPDNLPAHLLALRSVQSALQAGLLGLRVALVALVWLAIVPWMSIWTFRFYLTLGNTVAWTLSGRATFNLDPPESHVNPSQPTTANSTLLSQSGLSNSTLPSSLTDSPTPPGGRRTLADALRLVLARDVWPGQKLVATIVFIFLCAFLLREWTLGNGPLEEEEDRQAAAEGEGEERVVVRPAVGLDGGALAGEVVEEVVLEEFEEIVDSDEDGGKDDEDDEENSERIENRPPGDPVFNELPVNLTALGADESEAEAGPSRDNRGGRVFAEDSTVDELIQPSSPEPELPRWPLPDVDDIPGVRPFNPKRADVAFGPVPRNAEDETEVDTTRLQEDSQRNHNRILARLHGDRLERAALREAKKLEDQRAGEEPSGSTFRETQAGSTADENNLPATAASTSSPPPPVFPAEVVPPVELHPLPSWIIDDSSSSAVLSTLPRSPKSEPPDALASGKAREVPSDLAAEPSTSLPDALSGASDPGDGMIQGLRTVYPGRDEEERVAPEGDEEGDASGAGPPPKERSAEEEENAADDGSDWLDLSDDEDQVPLAGDENGVVVLPVERPPNLNPPPIIPLGPVFPPPAEAPPDDFGDQGEAAEAQMLAEEMEGLLEAVGIRGPLLGLLQNSTIITVIVSFFCALAVFLPFVLGKTVLLVNLFAIGRLLLLPIHSVRLVTDPILSLLTGHFLRLSPSTDDVLELNVRLASNHSRFTDLQAHLVNLTSSFTLPEYLTSSAADISVPEWAVERLVNNTVGEAFAEVGRSSRVVWQGLVGLPAWWKTADDLGLFEFSSGDSFTDRVVAVGAGYCVVAGLLWWLFQSKARWAKAACAEIQPAVTVFKLGVFMLIELVVFPFFCGSLLHLSCVPLLSERISLTSFENLTLHPLVSLGQHVLLGTIFMFGFANLLAFGRTKLRNGTFFFIRDPSDPSFNPVNEILTKRTWPQLKKLIISAGMYASMLLTCVGITCLTLRMVPLLLPLRWHAHHPIIEIPMDMIVLHLVSPVLIHRYAPHLLLRKALIGWLSFAVRSLRLSSYFFSPSLDPEATSHDVRDREDSRFKVVLDWVTSHMNPFGRTDFMQGVGGWARVPSKDHLSILPAKRMFVRLNESFAPLNQDELKLLVDINKKAVENRRNPAEDFGVIWLPPYVRNRVYLLLGALWAACLATGVCLCSVIAVGRLAVKLVVPVNVHDAYALLAGIVLLAGAMEVFNFHQKLMSRLTKARRVGKTPEMPWHLTGRKLRYFTTTVYGTLALTLFCPLAVGMLVETYLFLPWRSSNTTVPVVHVAEVWAVGVLSISCLVKARLDLPRSVLLRELDNAYGHQRFRWNAGRLSQRLLGPLLGGSVVAVVVPWLVVSLLTAGSSDASHNARVGRFVHPVLLLFACGYLASENAKTSFAVWTSKLREREYLVSMRLRNQGPPGPDDDALDGLPAGDGGRELVAVPPDMVGLLI